MSPAGAPCPAVERTGKWSVPLVALVAVLSTAMTAVQSMREQGFAARTQQDEHTHRLAAKVQAEIERMGVAAASAHGLLSASETVHSDEWRVFTDTLRRLHSVQPTESIAFVERVPPGELAAFLARVRADVLAAHVFQGNPSPERDELAIQRLDDVADGGAPGVGLDLATVPAMARAFERSIVNGGLVVTELVTEAHSDGDRRIVVCTPVFAKNRPLASVEERRTACQGWTVVSSPVADLVASALEVVGGAGTCSWEVLFAPEFAPLDPVLPSGLPGTGRRSVAEFVVGERRLQIRSTSQPRSMLRRHLWRCCCSAGC
jgi:CHASE1-domain containing sensor protein